MPTEQNRIRAAHARAELSRRVHERQQLPAWWTQPNRLLVRYQEQLAEAAWDEHCRTALDIIK
jgi:hypothetical protein